MLDETLKCDVAIVGAGPTGLTLANILGHAGLQVIVLERNESTVRAPRAVSIDDESLRTLQSIGLAQDVLKNAAADYGSYYYNAAGDCFAKVEPTTREYGYPRRSAFTQPALEQTLLKGAKRFLNVKLLFEHTVEGIQDTPHRVLVMSKSRGSAAVNVQAAYVVGCDGARSFCRKLIGSVLKGSSYPQRWLIVDLASTRELLRQTRVVCDPKRPLITLPGPGGIRRYEFMLKNDEEESTVTQPEFVRKLLAEHGPDEEAPLVRSQVYTFHALVADKWNEGRTFLAGDAAHLSPPFAGQGLNSGLRDAHNLGWKLAGVLCGQFRDTLLATYFSEREPHARALIQLAVQMGKIMMPPSRGSAFVVQNAFKLTRLLPRLHSYFAQMKYKPKPFYGSGFLADATGNPWIGRMFPQLMVEDSTGQACLLDECLGDVCQVVACGPQAQEWAEEASKCQLGFSNLQFLAILPSILNPNPDLMQRVEVIRALDKAVNAFKKESETIIMVLRPDRYIAAASSISPRDLATQSQFLFKSFGAAQDTMVPT